MGPRPMPGRGPRGMMSDKKLDMRTFSRLLGYLKKYVLRLVLVVICIAVTAVVTVTSASFIGGVIDEFITPALENGTPLDTAGLAGKIAVMAAVYLVGILASFANSRIMIVISQGILRDIRDSMFIKMQKFLCWQMKSRNVLKKMK